MSSADQSEDYCQLCRTSLDASKSHAYSKRHQNMLGNILKKFSAKMDEGRKCLKMPVVQSIFTQLNPNDSSEKFWCYFCNRDQHCHKIQDGWTIKYAEMLNHLSSNVHVSKMKRFWYLNHLDKEQQLGFYISQDNIKQFWKRVAILQTKIEKQKCQKLNEDAAEIRKVDQSRSEVVQATLCDLGSDESNLPGTSSSRRPHAADLPPWLIDEDEAKPAGPTLHDLQQHVEKQKKKQLPSRRVGANFNRRGAVSSQWLPSFGRVWNSGRRQQSAHEFHSETKRNNVQRRRAKYELI